MSLSNNEVVTQHQPFAGSLVIIANIIAVSAVKLYPLVGSEDLTSEEVLLHKSLSRIVLLTSAAVRQSNYYCGDCDTLSAVWCEASCIPEYLNLFVFEGDQRVVTVGEADGPFSCKSERNGQICGDETFSIYVSKSDLAECPYERGPALIRYLIGNEKGTTLCLRHAPLHKT